MAIYTIKTGCLTGSLDTAGRKIVRDSNGVLHVVYHRLETVNNIFHSYSSDGGVTWTEEAITTDATYDQEKASIAIDSSDGLHVVWTSGAASGCTKICYAHYTGSWSSPIDLSNDASYDQVNVSIAIDSSNRVYVAWQGNSATGWTIKYVFHATSWTAPADIPGQQIGAWYAYYNAMPSIAIDPNDNVYVVWTGLWTAGAYTQVQYAVYAGSWINAAVITSENYDQMYVHIAFASNGDALLVWHGKSSRSTRVTQIQFSRHTTAWSTPIDLTSSVSGQSCATIAVDSTDNIYVVWFQYGSQIKYAKYTAATDSWSAAADKTTGVSYKWHPYIMWQNQVYTIPTAGYCFVYMDDTTLKFFIEATLYVKSYSFPWVGRFQITHITA